MEDDPQDQHVLVLMSRLQTHHTLETATHGNSDINIWVIPVMQYLLNSINDKKEQGENWLCFNIFFPQAFKLTNDI